MRPREVRRLDESWTESSWGKPAYNQDSDCSPEPGCPVTWLVLNSRKHSLAAGLFTYQHQKSLFFLRFLKCEPFLKSLLNLLRYCYCFFFCVFLFSGQEVCGILTPWPGIEPALPALENEVSATGSPWKSPEVILASSSSGISIRGREGGKEGGRTRRWNLKRLISASASLNQFRSFQISVLSNMWTMEVTRTWEKSRHASPSVRLMV